MPWLTLTAQMKEAISANRSSAGHAAASQLLIAKHQRAGWYSHRELPVAERGGAIPKKAGGGLHFRNVLGDALRAKR